MFGWVDDINFKSRWRISSPWFPVKGNAVENWNLGAVSGLKNERKQ